MGIKKKLSLDYSYGEEKSEGIGNAEEHVFTDDVFEEGELIIGSTKAMQESKRKNEEVHKRARAKQEENRLKSKYLGYSDFLINGHDLNGYKFEESDTFSELDIKGWNLIIGYVLVRIVSPLLLIAQAVITGLVLWKVYEFDLTPNGTLAQTNCMPWVMGTLSVHAFFVHYISKTIFKDSYYRKRQSKKVAKQNV